MDIKHLDWNQYHSYIDKLATKIKADQYKYVAGLETEDMFVAIHLSHTLGLPVVTDINLLSMLIGFTENIQDVLVVANVVETGNTFKKLSDELGGEFDTGVLFKDKNSKFKPTYTVEVPDCHIYFPWEKCGISMEG
jgi:hypoxanthine phosphoribosyltransferase